ncbi:cysteine--tRNA ligase, partial [candidate division WWE3 bacterium]|nr:cysteine--tRNA ligase [candidate division WWE3 bacterium]
MTDLYLYNSLSRQKEKFEPIDPRNITMYACGPTVYGPAHVGNFRTFVLSDIVYRTLVFLGYETEYVMNITDVGHLVSDADEGEDKMSKGVRREGVSSAWELANKYIGVFLNDSQALGLLPPHVMPRATEHIEEQIDLIK